MDIFLNNSYLCVMAQHNQLGKSGEEYAAEYLIGKGYVIRDQNWRSGKYEIDLVAFRDNTLVVVEVKTRRNSLYAFPEEAVTLAKMRRMVHAAEAYIQMLGLPFEVRFDIVALIGEQPPFTIEHIEDAFVAPLNL